jgi:hypothetical protein
MQDGSYPPISLSPRAANFRLSKVRSAWWIACTVCALIGLRGLTIFEKPGKGSASGPMAEWLRRGLQILARRFDSGSGLHYLIKSENLQTLMPTCVAGQPLLIWRLIPGRRWQGRQDGANGLLRTASTRSRGPLLLLTPETARSRRKSLCPNWVESGHWAAMRAAPHWYMYGHPVANPATAAESIEITGPVAWTAREGGLRPKLH